MKRSLLIASLCFSVAAARPTHPKWPPHDYALNYGAWDAASVQRAHQFDLVVAHPGDDFDNLNADLVRQIQVGKDGEKGTPDDVIVLAYVTVGEDDRPPAGPPRSGESGSGPLVWAGQSLKATQGGYPPRYLDQVSYEFGKDGERKFAENGKPLTAKGHDHVPDENGVWGSYYVNPADKDWQRLLLAKMHRLEALGVDGFFLDTLDTASPWGNYSFTQPQMASTLQLLRKSFPDRFLLGNRGMFLLKDHRQAYLSSLDGVLYESMYSIWDWGAQRGVVSPWVVGDYWELKNSLRPAAQGNLHLFFVNYLDPNQWDFYPLLHSIEDLVGRTGISNYVSDPLLQKIQPPLSELFPEQGGSPPELGRLSLSELPLGRFRLACEISGMQGRALGQDLFLDVRFAKEIPAAAEDIALLPQAYIDYKALSPGDENGWQGSVEGVGMEQGTPYTVFARVVGKARSVRTPFLHVSFTTPRTGAPAQVTDLGTTALDGKIRLHWKPSPQAVSYKVYRGDSPLQLQPLGTTQTPTFLVTDVPNSHPYYFSVTPLNAAGVEGSLARPLLGRAEDCTPPAVPTGVSAQASAGGHLDVSWSPVQDAQSYKVYCLRDKEKYRIPLRIAAPDTTASVSGVAPGRYRVRVTSVDAAGNESRPGAPVTVVVK